MRNAGRYILSALLVILFVALFTATHIHREWMHLFFGKLSYYLTFLTFAAWLKTIYDVLKAQDFSPRTFITENRAGIIFSLLAAGVIFLTVETAYKTLADETNLLSVSKSMFENKTAYNVTTGRFYYGNFYLPDEPIPTRPLIFPFFTYILHVLSGFHAYNPFILNFAALFSLFVLIYVTAKMHLDTVSSLAAVLLTASYPLISVHATSGGFDLLSTLFLFLSLATLYRFLETPRPKQFNLLWMTLVVFMNIRYESFLVFGIVAAGLLTFRYVGWQIIDSSLAYLFATPLFTLPFYWQRVMTAGDTSGFPPGAIPFSVPNLVANLKEFLTAQFDFSFFLPYSNILNFIAFGVYVWLAVRFLFGKTFSAPRFKKHFIYISLLAFATVNGLYFVYYYGKYSHPSCARFFLGFAVLSAISPLFIRILKPQLVSGNALFSFAAALFLLYHPVAVENRFINTLELNREASASFSFLEKKKERNILVIADRPGMFAAQGYGASDFGYANINRNLLLNELGRHLYTAIYVFQKVDYATGLPSPANALDADYKLEPQYELQITAAQFLRVSRVSYDPASPPPNSGGRH